MKREHGDNIILLLDEPGTSLHAKAQEDLLRYFKEKLIPFHQVIYTTHSPFMVPADNLLSARTVEDVVKRDNNGNIEEILGTKVGEDVLSVDRETLFPLQGALGYEITQTLFIGKHSLLVEGPSDLLYLTAYSQELSKRGRTSLDKRWTVVPAGSIDKVGAFMSLLYGSRVNMAVFTDVAKGQKKKIEDFRKSQLLLQGHVLTAAEYAGMDEADVEDLLGRTGYVALVEQCYGLKTSLVVPNTPTRVVKDVEDAFRVLPPDTAEFDHFAPSSYLIRNSDQVSKLPEADAALDRFERLFIDLNKLIV
jgi:predicted ATP-dependent endonuclease of OLD family